MSASQPPTTADDQINELVGKARGGDPDAWDLLSGLLQARLERQVAAHLPAHLDAANLVNEALYRITRNIDYFDPQHSGAFFAWAAQITRNLIYDELRHERPCTPVHDLPSSAPLRRPNNADQSTPSRAASSEERRAIVAEMVATLPIQKQDWVREYYWNGLTHKVIAQKYQVPEGTIRAELTRVRQDLKLRFQARGLDFE
jgi:RNA polymerase sigma-70 factor, ECF subfamily